MAPPTRLKGCLALICLSSKVLFLALNLQSLHFLFKLLPSLISLSFSFAGEFPLVSGEFSLVVVALPDDDVLKNNIAVFNFCSSCLLWFANCKVLFESFPSSDELEFDALSSSTVSSPSVLILP